MKNSSTILAALIVAVVSGTIPGIVSVYTNKQILISNNEIKKMEIASDERVKKMDHFYNTCSLMRESAIKQEENMKAYTVSDDRIQHMLDVHERVSENDIKNHDLLVNNVTYGNHYLETFLLDEEKGAYDEGIAKYSKIKESDFRRGILLSSNLAMIYIRDKIKSCNGMGYSLKNEI